MIAHAKPVRSNACDVQQEFLSMLPAICSVAHHSFRHLRGNAHDEAVQEVVAHAFVAFTRLWRARAEAPGVRHGPGPIRRCSYAGQGAHWTRR